eukprot:TRINITY_DN40930_c0_g1_i2.p1 TRINITY_DN40930_c0_g1~~TRINITY_DN40930_c0_g1_i2.p1  ORF type:complete len:484 (-),score=120.97 TRINITY_DN40930_c0_g1_i2:196-1647(-)
MESPACTGTRTDATVVTLLVEDEAAVGTFVEADAHGLQCGKVFRVGRNEKCDFVCRLPGVSSFHFELNVDLRPPGGEDHSLKPGLRIKDTSSNGTGLQPPERTDTVRIGKDEGADVVDGTVIVFPLKVDANKGGKRKSLLVRFEKFGPAAASSPSEALAAAPFETPSAPRQVRPPVPAFALAAAGDALAAKPKPPVPLFGSALGAAAASADSPGPEAVGTDVGPAAPLKAAAARPPVPLFPVGLLSGAAPPPTGVAGSMVARTSTANGPPSAESVAVSTAATQRAVVPLFGFLSGDASAAPGAQPAAPGATETSSPEPQVVAKRDSRPASAALPVAEAPAVPYSDSSTGENQRNITAASAKKRSRPAQQLDSGTAAAAPNGRNILAASAKKRPKRATEASDARGVAASEAAGAAGVSEGKALLKAARAAEEGGKTDEARDKYKRGLELVLNALMTMDDSVPKKASLRRLAEEHLERAAKLDQR